MVYKIKNKKRKKTQIRAGSEIDFRWSYSEKGEKKRFTGIVDRVINPNKIEVFVKNPKRAIYTIEEEDIIKRKKY